jgi:hypothetical protein
MRKELLSFSEIMEEKLKLKDEIYGDSWKEMNLGELRSRLMREVEEWLVWSQKYDSTEEMREIIDIANISMMLYFRLEQQEKLRNLMSKD